MNAGDNKEKQLKQLSNDAAALPDDASPEEVATLQARITAVSHDIDTFMRSPFVIISRPVDRIEQDFQAEMTAFNTIWWWVDRWQGWRP